MGYKRGIARLWWMAPSHYPKLSWLHQRSSHTMLLHWSKRSMQLVKVDVMKNKWKRVETLREEGPLQGSCMMTYDDFQQLHCRFSFRIRLWDCVPFHRGRIMEVYWCLGEFIWRCFCCWYSNSISGSLLFQLQYQRWSTEPWHVQCVARHLLFWNNIWTVIFAVTCISLLSVNQSPPGSGLVPYKFVLFWLVKALEEQDSVWHTCGRSLLFSPAHHP